MPDRAMAVFGVFLWKTPGLAAVEALDADCTGAGKSLPGLWRYRWPV
jgi:hypothetical protein